MHPSFSPSYKISDKEFFLREGFSYFLSRVTEILVGEVSCNDSDTREHVLSIDSLASAVSTGVEHRETHWRGK